MSRLVFFLTPPFNSEASIILVHYVAYTFLRFVKVIGTYYRDFFFSFKIDVVSSMRNNRNSI